MYLDRQKMKNNAEILEQLIGINYKINNSLFNYIRFCDEKVENLFLQDEEKNNFSQKVYSDIIIISVYLCSLSYIIIASYTDISVYLYIIFFAISLVILLISYKCSKKKYFMCFR